MKIYSTKDAFLFMMVFVIKGLTLNADDLRTIRYNSGYSPVDNMK